MFTVTPPLRLQRADASSERVDDLDRRLANTAAAVRELCTKLAEEQVARPPRWATALLGDRPAEPARAGVYDQAVRVAARYRAAHGVRDGEPRLGAVPMNRSARAAFQHADSAVQAAKRALGQPQSPRAGDIGAGRAVAAPVQLSFDADARNDMRR
jgi:hypothetical protein